jgi:hypothetical protein
MKKLSLFVLFLALCAGALSMNLSGGNPGCIPHVTCPVK